MMKRGLIGLIGCLFYMSCFGQPQQSFASIDWTMQSVIAPTPDSLARFINLKFTTPLEKVRAAYSWIASHINYNSGFYKRRYGSYSYSADPLDTAAIWPSGDEMVARKVMRQKLAVCDGYAKLFKVLCDYTGVEAVIVQGYARGYNATKFGTNHSWNAVKIDSLWRLIDVTWASGYIDHKNDYVQKQNDDYFFTAPEQFVTDHYPEDLRWTLLSAPPMLSEFKKSPFRTKNFNKYAVASHTPNSGVIEAAVGDTIQFSVQWKDAVRTSQTGNDPFLDTATYALWPLNAFVKPAAKGREQVFYSYIVDAGFEWINLLYNDDVLMRYRINIIPRPSTLAAR